MRPSDRPLGMNRATWIWCGSRAPPALHRQYRRGARGNPVSHREGVHAGAPRRAGKPPLEPAPLPRECTTRIPRSRISESPCRAKGGGGPPRSHHLGPAARSAGYARRRRAHGRGTLGYSPPRRSQVRGPAPSGSRPQLRRAWRRTKATSGAGPRPRAAHARRSVSGRTRAAAPQGVHRATRIVAVRHPASECAPPRERHVARRGYAGGRRRAPPPPGG